jgi:hypothetical protein
LPANHFLRIIGTASKVAVTKLEAKQSREKVTSTLNLRKNDRHEFLNTSYSTAKHGATKAKELQREVSLAIIVLYEGKSVSSNTRPIVCPVT